MMSTRFQSLFSTGSNNKTCLNLTKFTDSCNNNEVGIDKGI